MFEPTLIKKDFPIFDQPAHQNLVYLDSAATSHKPQAVLTALTDYYRTANANVGRGVYDLATTSTQIFQASRQVIADFLGAKRSELILGRNATEAINGVAAGWAMSHLQPGDVILVSLLEHHANLVCWQQVATARQAKLEVVSLTADGQIDLEDLQAKLRQSAVKLVALSYLSNTLGSILPVAEVVKLVHHLAPTARILLDAAQATSHLPINFDQLGTDFLAFSGHKMLGPMGSGGLLVKQSLLTSGEFHPWLFGGGMIKEVSWEKTTFNDDLEERFVAGTPDVAGAVGLAAACQYLTKLHMAEVQAHDQQLVNYALAKLAAIPEIKIIGPVKNRAGSVAFIHQSAHAHDVAQILASEGIAVRSGHHCCMPLHHHYHWAGSVRASFSVYNSLADIDRLIAGLAKVKTVLG